MADKGTASAMQERLNALYEENERISNSIKVEEKGISVDADAAATFRRNLAEMREIKGLLDDLNATDEFKSYLAGPSTQSVAVAAAAAAAQDEPGVQAARRLLPKSLGALFTESDEFKALVRSGGATMPAPWEISGYDVTAYRDGYGQKDVYNGSGDYTFTIQPGLAGNEWDPMVPRAQRTQRVRDLFPVATTSANLIDYFRVIGFGSTRLDLTSSASMVPDRDQGQFGLKPHSSLTFQSAQAAVRTIAHYEVAHRNVLDDVPQLQSTINNELLYGLRLTEDNQILNGTGTSEDLLGVLNTPGIQTHAQSDNADDTKVDAVRRAFTKVALAYYEPTGLVVHPYDWEDMELTKAEDSGVYVLAVNVAQGAQKRVWSVPVVDSPAIAQGTFLTGAFGLGAQLYDRQQANIRVAEQHADFFLRNAVAILAEQRLALAVKRPESFVRGSFTS